MGEGLPDKNGSFKSLDEFLLKASPKSEQILLLKLQNGVIFLTIVVCPLTLPGTATFVLFTISIIQNHFH